MAKIAGWVYSQWPWSPASHPCPGPTPSSPHPSWFLSGSIGPLPGHEGLAPALMQEAGLWSREEKPRARSQVPGHQPWAQQLCLGLAPGPVSLGTELIEEKCSPGPRGPAGRGRGEGSSSPLPPPHRELCGSPLRVCGNSRSRLSCPPRVLTPWAGPATVAGGQQEAGARNPRSAG